MSDYNDYLLPEPCLRLDYGFGEQYASVELGDGTGYIRLRGREDREIELREKIARLNIKNVNLDVENAKLHGICGSMLKFMLPSDKRYSLKEQMSIIDNFVDMCRKLGIEVDG